VIGPPLTPTSDNQDPTNAFSSQEQTPPFFATLQVTPTSPHPIHSVSTELIFQGHIWPCCYL